MKRFVLSPLKAARALNRGGDWALTDEECKPGETISFAVMIEGAINSKQTTRQVIEVEVTDCTPTRHHDYEIEFKVLRTYTDKTK